MFHTLANSQISASEKQIFIDFEVQVEGESYYIEHSVITYAGVPHIECNEIWVCPALWPHFTQKVKQIIENNNKSAAFGGAPRAWALRFRAPG